MKKPKRVNISGARGVTRRTLPPFYLIYPIPETIDLSEVKDIQTRGQNARAEAAAART